MTESTSAKGAISSANSSPSGDSQSIYEDFEEEKGFGRFFVRYRHIILGITGIVVLLGGWEIAGGTHLVNPVFVSYPSQIARSMVTYFHSSTGLADLKATSEEFAIGLALTLAIGIPAGILIGWYQWLDDLVDPVMSFVYNAPRIALAPLLIVWFGLGYTSKIATVVLCAVFPVIISARGGVQEVDPVLISMARSNGAKSRTILRTIVLPGSIAPLSSGIRIGIGQGLAGAVFAEFIGASVGLGFTINNAATTLDTALMFDAVFVIAIIGVVLTTLLRIIEQKVQRWRI